jgi:type IX secretion system PorP/SprF family membrane protein
MKHFLYLLFFIAPVCCAQQQITFSQYMFHGLVLNPAYAGTDDAFNATFIARKQWSHIKSSPEIQSLIVHKYYDKKKAGLGAILENVSYGVTRTFSFNGIYAYKVKIDESKSLSLGLRAGLSSYSQKLTDLVLPPGSQDPSFDHNTSKTMFNAGVGAYYETSRYYAGLTASGLINNKLDNNRIEGSVLLAKQIPHYFLSGGYLFDINADVKLKTQVLFKIVSGAPLGTDVNVAALLKETVWVGVTYKHLNSLNALFEIKLKEQFKVGIAYDIATSRISKVTPGTYEISLNYRYLKKYDYRVMSPRYF